MRRAAAVAAGILEALGHTAMTTAITLLILTAHGVIQ